MTNVASWHGLKTHCHNDEQIVSSFRPHWKLLFIPFVWFLGLSIAMIFVAVAFDWLQWVVLLVLAGLLVYFVVRPLVAWWTTRCTSSPPSDSSRERALIAKSGVEIPLERITNVNFNQIGVRADARSGRSPRSSPRERPANRSSVRHPAPR